MASWLEKWKMNGAWAQGLGFGFWGSCVRASRRGSRGGERAARAAAQVRAPPRARMCLQLQRRRTVSAATCLARRVCCAAGTLSRNPRSPTRLALAGTVPFENPLYLKPNGGQGAAININQQVGRAHKVYMYIWARVMQLQNVRCRAVLLGSGPRGMSARSTPSGRRHDVSAPPARAPSIRACRDA